MLRAETYVGKPCKHGHSPLRYKSNRHCVDCTTAKTAEYQSEHRERYTEYTRAWRERNPENHFQDWAENNPFVARINNLISKMTEDQKTRFANWLLWKPHSRYLNRARNAYTVDCFLADYGGI